MDYLRVMLETCASPVSHSVCCALLSSVRKETHFVLDSMNYVVEEGAACSERGDQQFRLHVQCMLHLRITIADDAEDRLIDYILKHMNESEVGNVRLCVRVRQTGGSATVDRQIGSVARNAGKPHSQILYIKA
jgi:hypothetical protein